MSRLLLMPVLLLVGCPGAVDPAAGRSASARSNCRSFGLSGLQIDGLFDVARLDRDAGFTELESFTSGYAGCRGDFGAGCPENPNVFDVTSLNECIFGCTGCLTAVAREVYAE